MTIKEEAVRQAIRYSEDAKQALENNFNYMRSTTGNLLDQWNDANTARYVEMLELFDNYVKTTSANMDEIIQVLNHYLSFLNEFSH